METKNFKSFIFFTSSFCHFLVTIMAPRSDIIVVSSWCVIYDMYVVRSTNLALGTTDVY